MHQHTQGLTERNLLMRFVWSLLLNGGLAVGEIVMSVITGSTALLADGLNNLDDAAALILSIYSERLAVQPPDARHPFGHERMDVLAGLAKGCLLLLSAAVIVWRGVEFLLAPTEVPGLPVLITACVALAVNLITAMWMKEDACHSLNAHGTYLCMVYDALGSLAVIVGSLLTIVFGIFYFDVAASAVIVFFMVLSGWQLVRMASEIFLQTTPEDFDRDVFENAVRAVPHVTGVEQVMVWSHVPGVRYLTCRVAVDADDPLQCQQIVASIESLCRTDFNLQHSTIQLLFAQQAT